MPTPIVLELQAMATDSQNNISDLLRKALIVATKLKLDDFKKWIECELHGYGENEVPKYRVIRCEMKVKNPYRGLIPLYMDADLEDIFCTVPCQAAIENILTCLKGSEEGQSLHFPLSGEQKAMLMRGMEYQMEPVRLVSAASLSPIVDAVRSTILEWSLKLEEEGILGEGMQFTKEEKEKAAGSTQVHIGSFHGNFQGILGSVSHSSVEQNLTMTVKSGDFDSLADYLRQNRVEEQDIQDLKQALQQDPQPTSKDKLGPKVSSWMATMYQKAVSGAWDIGIGTAGSLLANAIWAYYELGG